MVFGAWISGIVFVLTVAYTSYVHLFESNPRTMKEVVMWGLVALTFVVFDIILHGGD